MSARIHEIAKQYNIEPKDMLVWLKQQGYVSADTKSVSSTVSKIYIEEIEKEFAAAIAAVAAAAARGGAAGARGPERGPRPAAASSGPHGARRDVSRQPRAHAPLWRRDRPAGARARRARFRADVGRDSRPAARRPGHHVAAGARTPGRRREHPHGPVAGRAPARDGRRRRGRAGRVSRRHGHDVHRRSRRDGSRRSPSPRSRSASPAAGRCRR